MNRVFRISVFLTLLILYSSRTSAKRSMFDEAETELTISISPGTIECFFQKALKHDTMEIEFQVIDAQLGDVELQPDLDISFKMTSPSGRELISDFKRPEAVHRLDIKEDGDHKLCFDNYHSRFTKKTVYFEVFIDSANGDDDIWEEFSFSPELMYNDTMDQIKMSMSKVHEHLNTIKHIQDLMKAIEARDRNLQEHNFTRVNQFSILYIVVMLLVGAIQVIMVRSLFEENSRLHKVFHMLS